MPDSDLQAIALRYAAGDLTPHEASAFEALLAEEQGARDALAEAVRLSAQAIGQSVPAPHPSFRALLRARLSLCAHRGSPLSWAGTGGAIVAACTVLALVLAGGEPRPAPAAPAGVLAPTVLTEHVAAPAVEHTAEEFAVAVVREEHPASVAEIWADLSDHQGVEKARNDEHRWRNHVRDLSHPHVSGTAKLSAGDALSP